MHPPNTQHPKNMRIENTAEQALTLTNGSLCGRAKIASLVPHIDSVAVG
jgi:hypothetical protein